jgi:hypothetical protein
VTFVPTPKADLQPLSDLYEGWNAFAQQILSRLWHAEQAADWAANAIADLYARLPGSGGVWEWDTITGVGKVNVAITVGNERLISVSRTDADGFQPSLIGLGQGSTVVLTDDPSTPPTTAFRQYVVAADPTSHGSWLSFPAVRVATFGTQDTPPVGSRVRLLVR